MEKKAYLILENGAVFEGKRFGAENDVIGEVVFTTGMTGYIGTLTDKSYHGQIVVQTFPLVGNYGIISSDFQSNAFSVKAYIVKEWCQDPSNFRSEGNLDTFLKQQNIPGLCGIDTRALTKILRTAGVMNGIISSTPEVDLQKLREYRVQHAVEAVSVKEPSTVQAQNSRFRVALWDFGAKENIRQCLLQRGCDVITMPCTATAAEICEQKPDGVMLSNGPGDPAENIGIIAQIAELMQSGIPIFGICLGHQLLALAAGAATQKLKFGHRGANQPVKDTTTGRVYITSQNHGYAVVPESLQSDVATMRFVNGNDGTCEGIDYLKHDAFSVQFHPEACGGPLDTSFLFDRFVSRMEEKKHAAE